MHNVSSSSLVTFCSTYFACGSSDYKPSVYSKIIQVYWAKVADVAFCLHSNDWSEHRQQKLLHSTHPILWREKEFGGPWESLKEVEPFIQSQIIITMK